MGQLDHARPSPPRAARASSRRRTHRPLLVPVATAEEWATSARRLPPVGHRLLDASELEGLEWPVWTVSAMKARIRRAAFVVDAWRPELSKIGALATVQRLNPCFVAFREAYVELKQRFPSGNFEWLTFGVDTNVFRPATGERDIFAYWMGRRYDPLHKALLDYRRDRGLEYRYSRVGGEFRNPEELGALVGRARYFLVTPPDLDNPIRTGGFSPLVMRYLEGLAAGARLLGVVPRSGEFEELIPRKALCEVKPDGSDLADRLDADAADREGWRIAEEARDLVRREHSWVRRAEQIYARRAQAEPVTA